jgi:hypothetical protein
MIALLPLVNLPFDWASIGMTPRRAAAITASGFCARRRCLASSIFCSASRCWERLPPRLS